jgi:ferredoxin
MAVINFVNDKKQVQVPEGTNLRKAAIKAGINLYPGVHKVLNCHGFGHCGSCRVLIHKGRENASPMGLWERLRLKLSMAYIGHEDEMRLACRTRVQGDMEVETRPAMNLYGENFFS